MQAFLVGIATNILKWALEKGAVLLKKYYNKTRKRKEIVDDEQATAINVKQMADEIETLEADLELAKQKNEIELQKALKRQIKQKEKDLRDVSARNNASFIDAFK